MINLTGKIITARTPLDADWEGWAYVMNDLETMQALIPFFKKSVWTVDELKARYANKALSLTILRNSDQKIIGQGGFDKIDYDKGTAEAGTILHREVWATGAAEDFKFLLFQYGFEELNLNIVFLHTDKHNLRTQGHLKKIGVPFITETTEGYLKYALRKEEWPLVKSFLSKTIDEKLL